MEGRMPTIIPLGNGSWQGKNDELRLLLRSLEKNALDLGEVYLVTDCCPEWVDREALTVFPMSDIYSGCKDANLHRKTLACIQAFGIGRFCWCADDNLLCKPMNLADIPVLHNHRPNERFYCQSPTKWQNRVRNTLEWAKARGSALPHNYECHCLQIFDGQALLRGMQDVDYVTQPGLTIYTTWRVVTDSWRESQNQLDFKNTYELPCTATDIRFDKPFIGYNDTAFGCIRERLFKEFPETSKYER